MKAMVLYIANGCKCDDSIDQFCEWSIDYDMSCKCYFFGQQIEKESELDKLAKVALG